MSELGQTIITIPVLIILGIITLMKPYMGLIFTVASQPIADVLPQVPLLSSIVPIFGALTIFGFLLQSRSQHFRYAFRFSSFHLIALLLLLWVFISHPAAAWSSGGRNWVFTFLQLFILAWFTGFLLTSPQKHHTLMWLFSLTAFISAVYAIIQGGNLSEIDPNIRAAGFSQGANTATRYFVIAFTFFTYLFIATKTRILKVFLFAGIVATFIGVFYTASRSGIMLLAIAIILLVLLQSRVKYRLEVGIISIVGLAFLLSFSENILRFVATIFPSISQGTDTVGLRYALWKAGFQMWLDNPIAGIGIGMFPSQLKLYPNPQYSYYFSHGLVAHNMYVSMLAETGIIGAFLFLALLISALVNFIKARKLADKTFSGIQRTWFIVFIVMLAGGITKTDQVDKLLWLCMGVGVFFNNYQHYLEQKVREPIKNGAAQSTIPSKVASNLR